MGEGVEGPQKAEIIIRYEKHTSYQAVYQPSGLPTGPALRLIPSLVLWLTLDCVSLSQSVLYIYFLNNCFLTGDIKIPNSRMTKTCREPEVIHVLKM